MFWLLCVCVFMLLDLSSSVGGSLAVGRGGGEVTCEAWLLLAWLG